MMKHPEGIDGLQPRIPYGIIVTKGRKADNKRGVVDREMFHLVSPFENDDKVRPYAPRFEPFNTAKPENRRLLFGMLVSPRRSQNFTYRLSMRGFPKSYPAPHARAFMLPVCEGDGVNALRWNQNAETNDELLSIKCPNEQCEFRLTEPPSCKPYASLSFMLQWNKGDMPTPLARIETHSKGSTRNLLGFFSHIEQIAKDSINLPPEQINWMGMRFILQLVQKTNPRKGRKWWEIVMSPEQDIVEFLRWQHERITALRQSIKDSELLPDLSEQDEETVYENIRRVEAPSRE